MERRGERITRDRKTFLEYVRMEARHKSRVSHGETSISTAKSVRMLQATDGHQKVSTSYLRPAPQTLCDLSRNNFRAQS